MAKGSHPTQGNYKQQLMNRKEVPSKEKEKFEHWLWDQETLRVFVDGSELRQGIFGLGVIFVGQGSTIVKSKKHYNQSMRRINVYAEIAVVEFALILIEQVMSNHFQQPSKVLIYSDWNEMEKLKDKILMTNRIPAINAIAEKINERKQHFFTAYPEVELEIAYLGEERKFNPFYKGAHNAARAAIGK